MRPEKGPLPGDGRARLRLAPDESRLNQRYFARIDGALRDIRLSRVERKIALQCSLRFRKFHLRWRTASA